MVSLERGVEPHGVVQGGLEVLLMLVAQRYCVKEAKVRDIGSHTAVHLDVAFPCNRSQPYQPWVPGLYSSGSAGRWGERDCHAQTYRLFTAQGVCVMGDREVRMEGRQG